MDSDRVRLKGLPADAHIRIRLGRIFEETPPSLPSSFDFSRAEGMMLGLAIGDALGNTSESQLPVERSARHGEIRDYLRFPGVPSDDSQLAFWTLEQLISDRGFVPEHVAERFSRQEIFGIGKTVKGFLRAYKSGTPWYSAGQPSAGNGALMRIAPILIPHLQQPTSDLWADAALCAMITHNDSHAISSAVAFVALLWDFLSAEKPPDWCEWLPRFVDILKQLECDETHIPRSPALRHFRGPLWKLLEDELSAAERGQWTVRAACDRWYSGAYLFETVPCVLYTLMCYADDPEEAIVRAVNDTRDNDTVAAIVGAAIGARHGRAALPRRWIDGLSGRTAHHDDARMFELLTSARKIWSVGL